MVIANSTALIIFARIQRLELLQNAFGELLIPPAVENELNVPGKPGVKEIQEADWIRTEPVKDRSFINQLPVSLDAGEKEAIALARELGAILLSDDRAARQTARQYGIELNSSLTVLQSAKSAGIIDKTKPLLDEMIAQDFRVSKQLYREFLERMDELPTESKDNDQ
jgi:hypothetical protein